jgi:hypothetical protein
MVEWAKGLSTAVKAAAAVVGALALLGGGLTAAGAYTDLPETVEMNAAELRGHHDTIQTIVLEGKDHDKHLDELKCLIGLTLTGEAATGAAVAGCSH